MNTVVRVERCHKDEAGHTHGHQEHSTQEGSAEFRSSRSGCTLALA